MSKRSKRRRKQKHDATDEAVQRFNETMKAAIRIEELYVEGRTDEGLLERYASLFQDVMAEYRRQGHKIPDYGWRDALEAKFFTYLNEGNPLTRYAKPPPTIARGGELKVLAERLHGIESSNDESRQQEYNELWRKFQGIAHALIERGTIERDSLVKSILRDDPPAIKERFITTQMFTGPEAIRTTTPQEVHQMTIDGFVNCQMTLQKLAQKDVKRQLASDDQVNFHVEQARKVWPLLRMARVYEFQPHHVFNIANELLEEKLAMNDDGSKVITRQMVIHFKGEGKNVSVVEHRLKKWHKTWEWPELPFDACYIGYGPGISVPRDVWEAYGYGDKMELAEQTEIDIIAHLVLHDGRVYEFAKIIDERTFEVKGMSYNEVRTRDGAWANVLAPTPQLLMELITEINQNQHIIIEKRGLGHRRAYEKAVKAQGWKIKRPTPPPYYIVPVVPKVTERKERLLPPKEIEWSHRWDVEGHYKHRVMRGPLPVPDEMRVKFSKPTSTGAQWQVWTTGGMPYWATVVLAKRGMRPKEVGEWVAILRWRQSAHIKGPEDKPYIPASRKVIQVTP